MVRTDYGIHIHSTTVIPAKAACPAHAGGIQPVTVIPDLETVSQHKKMSLHILRWREVGSISERCPDAIGTEVDIYYFGN
ncbi:hypothetical protein ASZ90_006823 [hydrocarbon metagenome]|uniref:Uncharacterized protein n=1 Tax=hydrocarbon metagenome TaxID=938273 RepID=A0A0W8FR20_9ZZZZ